MRVLGIIPAGFLALPAAAQDRDSHCIDTRDRSRMELSPGSLPERPTVVVLHPACLQPQ